jgi:uncharacterized protein (DUF433 family)
MTTQYIVKTAGVCGGRARLDGHRIRVQDIACCSEWWGWRPDRIATEFEISLSQVHSALAYYFDNIEEIRQEMQEELERYEAGKSCSPSLLKQKLGAGPGQDSKSA